MRGYWLPTGVLLALIAASSLFLGSGCVFYSSIGVPCPGCGMTRAGWALLHGDLAEAFHMHPLVYLLPALVPVGVALFLTREKMPRWWNAVLWGAFVLLIAVYAARMILIFPHDAPMTVNGDAWLPRLWRLLSGLPPER